MKEVYRSDAQDVAICEKNYIELYEKEIEIVDCKTLKKIKTKRICSNYYDTLCAWQDKMMIMVMCSSKNKIDILDMDTLHMKYSIEWNGESSYRRQRISFDDNKKCLYSILYSDTERKTVVTQTFSDDFQEKIILEVSDFLAYDLQYIKSEDDYLLYGAHFTYKKNIFALSSIQEGVWLQKRKGKILFVEANKGGGRTVKTVGVLRNKDWIYSVEGTKDKVYFLGNKKALIKNIDRAAFSENGEMIAFVRDEMLYIYSWDDGKCVDEIEIGYISGEIHSLKFIKNDEFIFYRDNEGVLLYRMRDDSHLFR